MLLSYRIEGAFVRKMKLIKTFVQPFCFYFVNRLDLINSTFFLFNLFLKRIFVFTLIFIVGTKFLFIFHQIIGYEKIDFSTTCTWNYYDEYQCFRSKIIR